MPGSFVLHVKQFRIESEGSAFGGHLRLLGSISVVSRTHFIERTHCPTGPIPIGPVVHEAAMIGYRVGKPSAQAEVKPLECTAQRARFLIDDNDREVALRRRTDSRAVSA